MNRPELVRELQLLIDEMRREEQFCDSQARKNLSREEHYQSYRGGICQCRVKIEAILDDCGYHRPNTIEGDVLC